MWYDIGNLVIGAGIFVMLFNMNKTIGCLTSKVEMLLERDADKEARLRAVEAARGQ